MRFLLCSLFCLLFARPLRAEELLVKVQRELRARKYYFGEIDGHATDETVAAIKNFQVAKAIYKTGQIDYETLRALGLPELATVNPDEERTIEDCGSCVLHYLQAWQSGEWEREASFFTDIVNYYDDQNVSRDFIRVVRAREIRRWPHRKATMLNRIASLEPNHADQAQVTARVRTEVGSATEPARSRTEDLIFRLQKEVRGWRIAAVKLLE